MKFLIIFIFLIPNVMANEVPNIKNIVINKELKTYENISFLDSNEKTIKLSDYKGNLILLNFWATWCAPCKEEMPSLDSLMINPGLDNLKIFAINIGKENFEKSSIKMNRGTSNFSDKDKKILDDKINENKDTIDSKNYEIPKKIYKNYQNQNTYDKDKKSVQFDQDQQSFPQFSLNVSNPISWKLMLLIMLMQLLTNIMLVVVLYLK